MARFLKRLSITSRSLRPQLIIAFCLMSVIPILVLLNVVFPSVLILTKSFFPFLIGVVILISLFGFFLIKKIIDPIVKMASEAKTIARGELSREINVVRDDEIGAIGDVLNQLTHRVKDNMDELKVYGERTKEINVRINKQIMALSGVLQISNLIANGMALSEVFEISISKLAQVANSSLAFLIMVENEKWVIKAFYGLSPDSVEALGLPANHYLFDRLRQVKPYLKVDRKSSAQFSMEIRKFFEARNLLSYPLIVRGEAVGFVGIGSQLEDYEYTEDSLDLVDIFAKQLGIALENHFLVQRVENLEIKDALTGLYNRKYIFSRLSEEVTRGIMLQRPCGFVVIKLCGLKELQTQSGALVGEKIIKKLSRAITSHISDIDRAGRIDDDEFAIILPEKSKKRAEFVASEVKKSIENIFIQDDALKSLRVSAVVVENPIDGADAESLMSKAIELLKTEVG